jgi:protein SCO1/2
MLAAPTQIIFAQGHGAARAVAPVESGVPKPLVNVGIEQNLNEQLPLDAIFKDELGNEVPLGKYFGERPVVLALVYYECPMLCNQVLNGTLSSVSTLSEATYSAQAQD